MKKRLLALALCLVLATSLLPVTVFATENAGGVYYKGPNKICIEEDFVFTFTIDEGLISKMSGIRIGRWPDALVHPYAVSNSGQTYTVTFSSLDLKYFFQSGDVATLYIGADDIGGWTEVNHFVETQIEFGHIGGTATCCKKAVCSTCGQEYGELDTEAHDWKFTISKNNDTLTGECQNTDCGKKVSVSLEADSVTLPNSPFNARLEGWEAFKKAVPSAYYNSFDYKLNGEEVVDQSSPKAGNYQAGVRIYGLPSPVEYSGAAARANMDGNGYSAYLFTQYTAADPKVTAQTGDNRPIELMMGSVVVFSALAAAAFILDSKRRSRQ